MAVITISRQFGAGGRTLGKMIADELGYTFADSGIITRIAEMANVSTNWVEAFEKEAGSRVSRLISSMVAKRWVETILRDEHGYLDEQIYLDYLVLIIAQIADEGNVVILGRGSQYILNDHPDAFHILLIDNFENRVRFMMERYNLPGKKALQVITSEDKRRFSLYRRLGKTNFDDPNLYNLVINHARVDLDKAKRLVIEMIRP